MLEESEESYEKFEQELIEQYAMDLQQIYKHATVVDENGEIETNPYMYMVRNGKLERIDDKNRILNFL